MNLNPQDPRFAAAGLTVDEQGKTARILQGETELAQISTKTGQLTFHPERSAKQKAVLRMIGALE